MKTLTYILIAMCLTSCFSTITDDQITLIDPTLKPYVDSFINEASVRGVKIDAWNIKVGFGQLPDNDADGRTYYLVKTIVIDSTSLSWKTAPEALVFHELGHLLLNRRGHDNSTLPNGCYKTIMNNWGAVHYEYKGQEKRRDYYIEELFHPNTEAPEWSNH